MDLRIWFIAWRTVVRQLRRFMTVILMAVLGIAIISLIQGLLSGVDRNIYAAAGRYYGGDVLVMGTRIIPRHEDYAPAADGPALKKIADSFGEAVKASNFRTGINFQGTVFFDGVSQQLKRINGIDWLQEASLIQNLDLIDHANSALADNSMILSKATADRLKCGVGSAILLQILRNDGQIDTKRLIVWGIYRDAAVFGPFNAYASRTTLNTVLGFQPDDFTSFTMTLAPGLDRTEFSRKFHLAMQKVLPSLTLVHSRNEYNDLKFAISGADTYYAAMPVDFSVDQLNQLNEALLTGLLVLMGFIGLTVAVGTFNTYRIMLDERTRELGSMRAMGLTAKGLRDLVLVEGLIVAIICSLAGLFVSMLAIGGLSYVPLGKIPGLDLFLNRGQLNPVVSWWEYGIDIAVMMLMLEFSAWMAARRVRNISPIEAINRR